MPVAITAVLDHQTVAELLSELTPLTINLGEGGQSNRWMQVERPDLVEFVAGQGVRLRTSAKLQWSVAGVPLSFTIQTVSILLKPVISGARLNVIPTIESADLKNVPERIDHGIVAHINTRLAAIPEALGWSFGETLA